jgi:hypothetical protein
LIFLAIKLAVSLANGWSFKISDNKDQVCFYLLDFLPGIGATIGASITVNSRKRVFIAISGKIKKTATYDWIENRTLKTWKDLLQLLDVVMTTAATENVLNETDQTVDECVKDCVKILRKITFEKKVDRKREILVDQLNNLNKPSNFWRFGKLAAFHLRNISTACYNVMLPMFTFPSIRKLRTMSTDFNVMDNVHYFTELAKKLVPLERVVSIENLPCESVDFKSSKLHGFAVVCLMFVHVFNFKFRIFPDNQKKRRHKIGKSPPKTAYCIMIESTFGKYKEIVENIPCAGDDAKTLASRLLKCINCLQSLGFTVVSISVDNNRINQSLFKILSSVTGGIDGKSFPNSGHEGEIIFMFYDAVHIFKNIRNNWFCLKNLLKTFQFPNFNDFYNCQTF